MAALQPTKKTSKKEKETATQWVSQRLLQNGGIYPSPNQWTYQIQWPTYPNSFQFNPGWIQFEENLWKPRPEPKATKRAMPVIGYRGWKVVKKGEQLRLQSVNPHFGMWGTRVTKATCRGKHKHRAPHYYCECGLYVLADLKAAPKWYSANGIPEDVVVGAVVGWGNVIQHGAEGWRAEYARPIALLQTDVFGEQPLLVEVAKQYRLPIMSRRGLELMAAEYGERLAP